MVKNLPAHTGASGNAALILEWGRYARGGNGNPLQFSCLGNPMDRGAWQATVHGTEHTHTKPIIVVVALAIPRVK